MRPTANALLSVGVVSFVALASAATTPASGQVPNPAPASIPAAPRAAAPVVLPGPVGTAPAATAAPPVRPASMTATPARPASAATPDVAVSRTATTARAASSPPAAYWGPAPPAAPKRKPTAVGRLFNRIGDFLGADEDMGTTPVYRDPTTGRTNTGTSKPWMRRMPSE